MGHVGGDFNVSSAADTGKVKGKEFDISVTATFGLGKGVSGSVGYGQTTGKTDWVEEQTSITGKNKVDIRTENHTQIDGAVIAADNGNLKLDTNTLGFSDIAGQDKEHGYYLNVGGTYKAGGSDSKGSTAQDGSQVGKGKEGQTGWSVEGWSYEKDREQIVRATVGAGEIVVRKDAETGADSTSGLSRDVSKAYEVTKDAEKRTDLYASSSSIDAVMDSEKTAKDLVKDAVNFSENQKKKILEVANALDQIKGEIQAQRVSINDVSAKTRKTFGDEQALTIAKNLARKGLDPNTLDALPSEVVSALTDFSQKAEIYNKKIKSCIDDGSCPSASSGEQKTGQTLELAATSISNLPRNGGEAALDGIVDLVKISKTLPIEQFQAAMLSVQAMMGPLKFVVSAVANTVVKEVAGDKYQEYKESAAIELAAKLTDRKVETMRKFHEEAKADADSVLNGNEYVVATEFLIDAVLGEVKSLGMKAGSKVFANDSKGPLLPESYWKNKEAPIQVTPGTTRAVDIKPSSRKKDEFYERTTHYDEYGRSKGQTHMTDHGQPDVHPNPHHHVRDVERNQNVKGARPGVHPDY